MAKVAAFLRGINVGGHIARKEQLQRAFTALGYSSVTTHKQSGNVTFETDGTDLEATKAKIEKELRKVLGYDVVVFVRTFADLRRVVERGSNFRLEKGTSLMVTMLPSSTPEPLPSLPLTIPKSTARVVSAYGSEIFSLTHGGGEGGLPNQFLEAKLRAKTTTRNMNVIVEIVQEHG
jgi:uncharacterized protein (DUF1697 family)